MGKEKIIYVGELKKKDVSVEDGGQAMVSDPFSTNGDNGMFVRIQSWDEKKKHEDFKKFQGRKIRVTIETVD